MAEVRLADRGRTDAGKATVRGAEGQRPFAAPAKSGSRAGSRMPEADAGLAVRGAAGGFPRGDREPGEKNSSGGLL